MFAVTLSLAEYVGLLAIVLTVGASGGVALGRYRARRRRREAWKAKKWPGNERGRDVAGREADVSKAGSSETGAPKQLDAADQLRIVMSAEFAVQPLLNRSEARVFRELDRFVLSCNPGWQVMAQVSLGEILRSKNADAYRCINSKRVDLLLIDESCRPHAIEYQGQGHHQATAAARDAVKKEALRRAGIGYHEVVSGQTTPSELRRLVERLVGKPIPAQ
jgi:hypothetical protein